MTNLKEFVYEDVILEGHHLGFCLKIGYEVMAVLICNSCVGEGDDSLWRVVIGCPIIDIMTHTSSLIPNESYAVGNGLFQINVLFSCVVQACQCGPRPNLYEHSKVKETRKQFYVQSFCCDAHN